MVKFHYKEKTPFKLDLVPMINIVFLLLIFFMLTATTSSKEGSKVELPKAKTGEKSNKHYLNVTIDKKDTKNNLEIHNFLHNEQIHLNYAK